MFKSLILSTKLNTTVLDWTWEPWSFFSILTDILSIQVSERTRFLIKTSWNFCELKGIYTVKIYCTNTVWNDFCQKCGWNEPQFISGPLFEQKPSNQVLVTSSSQLYLYSNSVHGDNKNSFGLHSFRVWPVMLVFWPFETFLLLEI